MKQTVAVSLAGLMLLTSGYEFGHGKNFAARAPKSKKATAQDVGEKNIHDQWQGRSNPSLYDGGFFVRGDFLYWRADEEGLEYGAVTRVQSTTNSNHLESPSVQWNAGFRLGLGYTFAGQDYWELDALWTHFNTHQSASKSFVGDTGTFFTPEWGTTVLGNLADQASVRWDLHYNTYDLDLGRNYFVSKTVAMHPFVGMRGATIHQIYHAKYNGIEGNSTSFKARTDFWGVGAHLGSAFQWHITSCFSFLGNVVGSLLYGDFKIRENYHVTDMQFPIQEHVTTGSFNVDAMLGFQWERFFYQNKYRLAITAGYEWSEWFSQNRMIKLDRITAGTRLDKQKGDLSLQGASLQVRFDF